MFLQKMAKRKQLRLFLVQGIKGTINKDKSYKVDRSMDVLEGQLQKTTNPEVRKKLKNEFNKKVDNFDDIIIKI